MVQSRESDVLLAKALGMMEEALAILDDHEHFDVIALRLQEAIDEGRDHQSSTAPRD